MCVVQFTNTVFQHWFYHAPPPFLIFIYLIWLCWVLVVLVVACVHVGSQFPNQGLNPSPLHLKADSQPLDHQGSPWAPFCQGIYISQASLVAQWYRICPPSRRSGYDHWVRKIPWKRKWQPTPVFLSGESHGQRSLADCSPWGCKESDTTEQLSAYIHTRYI